MRKEKLVHEAGHVSDKGCSLLEINCILWIYNYFDLVEVSTRLQIKSIYADNLGYL